MGIEVHSEGIDKSIVQLEKSLGGLVDQAGQYVARKLQELMIKRYGASGIKNRTGALKDSLVVHYDPKTNQIYLAIKIYGVFLSYGVGPRVRKGKVYNIDDWVLKSLSFLVMSLNTSGLINSRSPSFLVIN